jgi:hypothetical protein
VTGGRGDWLETLARRSVGGPSGTAQVSDEDAGGSNARFSRRTAVRLGVGGAISLSLGLMRPDPARAFDFGECLDGCHSATEKWLQRQIQACEDVFSPTTLRNDSAWQQILDFMFWPPYIIAASLFDICVGKAYADAAQVKAGCYLDCNRIRRTCRKTDGRSLQGASSTCEVTPPPKNEKPEIPPAPNPEANDPCEPCSLVPNCICCGPITDGHACGFADTRNVPACESVGC